MDDSDRIYWDGIINRDINKVKQALQKGADPTNRGRHLWHALSDPPLLQLILEAKAHVEPDPRCGSYLHVLIGEDKLKSLEILLRFKPNLEIVTYKTTPLEHAMDCGKTEAVKMLLTAGAKISHCDTVIPQEYADLHYCLVNCRSARVAFCRAARRVIHKDLIPEICDLIWKSRFNENWLL